MATFWLSFCDPALPQGSRLLGVILVEAPDFSIAVVKTHALGINPGGEILGGPLPPWCVVAEGFKNRLLSRAEATEVEQGFLPRSPTVGEA